MIVVDHDMAKAIDIVGTIAGWEVIICECSAMYYTMAQLINDKWGKLMLLIELFMFLTNRTRDQKKRGKDHDIFLVN